MASRRAMTMLLAISSLLAPFGFRFVFFVNANIFLGVLGKAPVSIEAKRAIWLEWVCGALWAFAGIALLFDLMPRPMFVTLWVCGIISHITVLMWRVTSKR